MVKRNKSREKEKKKTVKLKRKHGKEMREKFKEDPTKDFQRPKRQ